jgi:hypothetical protein
MSIQITNGYTLSRNVAAAPNFIQPVNGRIPIVRIYNKQLSDAQILHNYNTQKGRFGL